MYVIGLYGIPDNLPKEYISNFFFFNFFNIFVVHQVVKRQNVSKDTVPLFFRMPEWQYGALPLHCLCSLFVCDWPARHTHQAMHMFLSVRVLLHQAETYRKKRNTTVLSLECIRKLHFFAD